MKCIRPGQAVACLLAAALVALPGCGTAPPAAGRTSGSAGATGTGPPPATGPHNEADVMFLQMMVSHHDQALALVRLAATRQVRPEVKILAAAIESTQRSERDTMAGWLRDWRQPPTADPTAHAAHGGMPGTSAAEIARTGNTAPAQFERAFLRALATHQVGAVQLARHETTTGSSPIVKDLARRIQVSREAQVAQIQGYLDGPAD